MGLVVHLGLTRPESNLCKSWAHRSWSKILPILLLVIGIKDLECIPAANVKRPTFYKVGDF